MQAQEANWPWETATLVSNALLVCDDTARHGMYVMEAKRSMRNKSRFESHRLVEAAQLHRSLLREFENFLQFDIIFTRSAVCKGVWQEANRDCVALIGAEAEEFGRNTGGIGRMEISFVSFHVAPIKAWGLLGALGGASISSLCSLLAAVLFHSALC